MLMLSTSAKTVTMSARECKQMRLWQTVDVRISKMSICYESAILILKGLNI